MINVFVKQKQLKEKGNISQENTKKNGRISPEMKEAKG
jgi:hypothetical protein